MKRNTLTLVIGAVLILIFALLLFTFQVRKSEVAVVTTFGKPTRNVTAPGSDPRGHVAVSNDGEVRIGPVAAISALISARSCGCPVLKVTPPLSVVDACFTRHRRKQLSYRIL